MTENTALWDRHADIDPRYTKQITGKAYKGTSPSPQHVIWCLTDMFGPMGQGFGAHVVAEGFQNLGDEVLHWCRIEFWHGERSNTFETYGQTKALAQTKNGLKSDEDAPKKSFTDALVKAASYVGVASNIFLGRWDDQKYVRHLEEEFSKTPELTPEEKAAKAKAFADETIKQVRSCSSLEGLSEGEAAIQEAMARLRENHNGLWQDVTNALQEARARLSHQSGTQH